MRYYQYPSMSVSNNHPKANISHFKIIDQHSKHIAREAKEAIRIRINNPALNHNTGKLYISEILSNLLGADGSTNEYNPMGDSDNPKSHSPYCSKQQVWQCSVFGKLGSLSITTYSIGIPPSHQLPRDTVFYLKGQNSSIGAKRCFVHLISVFTVLITLSTVVRHPMTA